MMMSVIPRKAMIGTYQCTDDVVCDPRKAMIGTYQYTDDVVCDPQEGYDWYLPVHR